MEGRRTTQRNRKYNPLFVLFLCLVAALIVMLIVTIALSMKLGKTNKNLKTAEANVHELEQTVAKLEDDLATAKARAGADTTEPAETTEPEPATPGVAPEQQSQQTQQSQVLAPWLDITGHSEVQKTPTDLLDGYQTYYASESVNLRGGPATSYTRITTVERGTAVKVAAREGNWSFVKVGNKFGWINSDYLSKNQPAPVTEKAATTTTTRTESTSGSLKTQ